MSLKLTVKIMSKYLKIQLTFVFTLLCCSIMLIRETIIIFICCSIMLIRKVFKIFRKKFIKKSSFEFQKADETLFRSL